MRQSTGGLEPLACSSRVTIAVLQRCGRLCKFPIPKPASLPCLAPSCTTLCSRWNLSGIRWCQASGTLVGAPGTSARIPGWRTCSVSCPAAEGSQLEEKLKAGESWLDNGLVFTTGEGKPLTPRTSSTGTSSPCSSGQDCRISGSTIYGIAACRSSPSAASRSATCRPSLGTPAPLSPSNATPTTTTPRRGAPPTRFPEEP